MFEGLLPYYLKELEALQADTAGFAKAYPSQAARLRIPANVGTEPVGDPHVERLLEGVAFMGARVQHRLDDEFPELTDALLSVLYPHYLAPFPSCLVAGFPGRPAQDRPAAIPAGTMLETRPIRDEICRFRTTAPVTVWPVEIAQARLSGMPLPAPDNPYARAAVSVLQLTLRCTTRGLGFEPLRMDRLRFFLGSPDRASVQLYELLAAHAVSVAFTGQGGGAAPVIPAEASLQPVGFEPDEALLPWDKRGFSGFRLLSEYFAFPHKFMFIDLCGIPSTGFGETMEVFIYLDQDAPDLVRSVNAQSLQLGCAPAVNLFPMTCDPITLDHTQTEYLVTPERRRMHALEIWSITGVRETREGDARPWRPFYRLTSGSGAAAGGTTGPSYLTIRREAAEGSDVWIAPCDPVLDPDGPAATRLSVDALCTNRDLLRQLPVDAPLRIAGGGSGLEGARAVTAATAPLRPRLREKRFWRLISHLALGHLSLTGDDTAQALREVLRLYNLDNSERAEAAISALQAVAQRPYSMRAPGSRVGAFCRGLEVDLIFAARQWEQLGLFLMASVLSRFLPLQGQVNSFVRVRALRSGKQAPEATWPPRAGGRALL